MPGSPVTSTTWPAPASARDQQRRKRSISSRRPTSSSMPALRSASKRPVPALSPATCHTATGARSSASTSGCISRQSKNAPMSPRVRLVMSTLSGGAADCSRRARLRAWPVAAISPEGAGDAPTIITPVAIPICALSAPGASTARTASTSSSPARTARSGIVLLRPLVSEIDRHAVAQGLRDEAAEALGDIGAGAVNRAHQLGLVLGAEPGRYGGQAADPARQDAQLPELARARRVACLLGRRRDRRRARPFGLFDAGGELVAHARQGEDEARAIGIRLDLAPQPGHQHVDAAFVGVMVAARDAVAQLIACQHAAAAARQQCQQPELGAREGDLPPVLVHKRMAGEIERASLEAQDFCRPCGFARLRCGDAGQERCEPLLVQRRREKCVCIRKEAGQRGEGGALLGDDDDPAAAGAQRSSQRDACLPAGRGRHDGGSQPTRVRRRAAGLSRPTIRRSPAPEPCEPVSREERAPRPQSERASSCQAPSPRPPDLSR